MKVSHMLLGQRDDQVELPANALGTAFEPVAAELRLVDVGDFIAYIHAEKFAEFALDWNSLPVITLDMEFRHRSVWLVFKLILRALQTNVMVEHLSLGKTSGDPRQDMAALIETIADARLRSHGH